MPFGPDCEYEDFDACVKDNQDKDDPEAYCAELERRTKEHCDQAILEKGLQKLDEFVQWVKTRGR